MFNNKFKVSLFSSIAAILMIGCGNGDSDNSTNSDGSTSDGNERIEISTLQPYWGNMPDEDGPLFQKVEEIMGAEITPTFVQGPNMMDRLNVTLASGELPDIMVVFEGNQPSIVQAVRAGAFWEVGAYLDDYPNLKASRDEIRDTNISIDGKIYALYDPEFIARTGFNIRQDWLDNLGLDIPTSIDELYEVLRAFTYDDPDGNGVDDTFGVAALSYSSVLIPEEFGAPNGYKVEEGKFTPAFETDEFREAMKFSRRLYEEGIMNQDFAYVQQNQTDEMLQRGEVGVYIGNVDRADIFSVLLENQPEAKITSFSNLGNNNAIHTFLGFWNTLMFPKSSIETEERLHEILGALDRYADPEHREFRLNGLEDVEDSGMMGKMEALNVLALNAPEADPDELEDWHGDMVRVVMENENSDNLVGNPANALLSETAAEVGNELTTLLQDAQVNYVLGELDDAGFDAVIEEWYARGGAQIIQEFEEQYAEMNN